VVLFACRLLFWAGLSGSLSYTPFNTWIFSISGYKDLLIHILVAAVIMATMVVLSFGHLFPFSRYKVEDNLDQGTMCQTPRRRVFKRQQLQTRDSNQMTIAS